MPIIKPLPSWAIINRFPAFYEGESLTAIEQTARIYAKVNELITTYNRFVTENNAELTELEQQVQKDLSCAIRTIIKLTDSYITQVELRLGHQDRKLDEQYKALTDDITDTVDSLIRQMKEAGELDQVILDAIDNLNTKFDNYTAGIAEEQAALKADYDAAKAALNSEYAECMDNINTYFAQMQSELREDMAENALFREHTSVTLAEFTDTDGVGATVPRIKDYSIVGVQFAELGLYCICKVRKTNDGIIYVDGTGYGDASFGTTSRLRVPSVHITLNYDGVIGNIEAGYVQINGISDLVTLLSDTCTISRIDGLVLNGGNIS